MICPNCLIEVEEFEPAIPHREKPGYKCPSCKETVPESYVSDYWEYPPIVFFLMGLPGHGKSLYLARLFSEFERIGSEWREFFYTPIDESKFEIVRNHQHALDEGEAIELERRLFKKPGILRLDNVPELGKCQLLIVDAAAETEPEPHEMRNLSGYFARNNVVVLMLSLNDVKSKAELTDFLTRYTKIVTKAGGSVGAQTLIVALTKCDTLLSNKELPEYVHKAILGRQETSAEEVDEAEELSAVIEAWLDRQSATMNFVRRARTDFKDVRFTISNAAQTVTDVESAITERAPVEVWSLLKMVWKTQQKYLKQTQRRQVKEKIGRAAKDSITQVGRSVLFGLLGLIEGAVWGALLWGISGGFDAFLDKHTLNEILNGAVKLGTWGIIWGALVWLVAGLSDAAKESGVYTRVGVRLGAIAGFFLNGVFAGVIWGITLSIAAILKESTAFSASLLIDHALTGVVLGAKLGAILGAVWGLVIRTVSDIEARTAAGLVWSLLIAAIAASALHVLTGLELLKTSFAWGGAAVIVFALWVVIKRK